MSKTKESALDKIRNGQSETPTVPTFQGMNANGIMKFLDNNYRTAISKAMPTHKSVDRYIALATQIITRSPKLLDCTAKSIVGSVMRATALGLDFSPEIGECYLIPRWNKDIGARECTFLIGYRGYITMAANTGVIKSLSARTVRKGDVFSYSYGLDETLIHRPKMDGVGELEYVYCIWRFLNGGIYFEVMNEKQVEAAKKKSEAANSEYSPWSNPDQVPDMWIKTVIRHSRKYVPISSEKLGAFVKSLAADDKVLDPDDAVDDAAKIILDDSDIKTEPDKPAQEPTEDVLRDTQSDKIEKRDEPVSNGTTLDDLHKEKEDPDKSIGDENSRPPE